MGCGDGSTLPFLRGAGADDARYCGLDLSGRMIAAARAAHPAATFEQAGFFGAALAAPPRRYDCVLFNGSLVRMACSDADGTCSVADFAAALKPYIVTDYERECAPRGASAKGAAGTAGI